MKIHTHKTTTVAWRIELEELTLEEVIELRDIFGGLDSSPVTQPIYRRLNEVAKEMGA